MILIFMFEFDLRSVIR